MMAGTLHALCAGPAAAHRRYNVADRLLDVFADGLNVPGRSCPTTPTRTTHQSGTAWPRWSWSLLEETFDVRLKTSDIMRMRSIGIARECSATRASKTLTGHVRLRCPDERTHPLAGAPRCTSPRSRRYHVGVAASFTATAGALHRRGAARRRRPTRASSPTSTKSIRSASSRAACSAPGRPSRAALAHRGRVRGRRVAAAEGHSAAAAAARRGRRPDRADAPNAHRRTVVSIVVGIHRFRAIVGSTRRVHDVIGAARQGGQHVIDGLGTPTACDSSITAESSRSSAHDRPRPARLPALPPALPPVVSRRSATRVATAVRRSTGCRRR